MSDVSKSNNTAANPVALEIIEKKDCKYSYSYSRGERRKDFKSMPRSGWKRIPNYIRTP